MTTLSFNELEQALKAASKVRDSLRINENDSDHVRLVYEFIRYFDAKDDAINHSISIEQKNHAKVLMGHYLSLIQKIKDKYNIPTKEAIEHHDSIISERANILVDAAVSANNLFLDKDTRARLHEIYFQYHLASHPYPRIPMPDEDEVAFEVERMGRMQEWWEKSIAFVADLVEDRDNTKAPRTQPITSMPTRAIVSVHERYKRYVVCLPPDKTKTIEVYLSEKESDRVAEIWKDLDALYDKPVGIESNEEKWSRIMSEDDRLIDECLDEEQKALEAELLHIVDTAENRVQIAERV